MGKAARDIAQRLYAHLTCRVNDANMIRAESVAHVTRQGDLPFAGDFDRLYSGSHALLYITCFTFYRKSAGPSYYIPLNRWAWLRLTSSFSGRPLIATRWRPRSSRTTPAMARASIGSSGGSARTPRGTGTGFSGIQRVRR